MPKEEKKFIHNYPSQKITGHHQTEQEEEHPWLLSYSDMFTLLFCLFVVFIAMAFKHLDWVKIEEMLRVFSRHEEMSLPDLYEKIKHLIKQYGLEETVNVQLTSRGVEIDFKEKATFNKGEAKLKAEILPILAIIAKLFNEKGIDRRKIIVEGHTDSLPISTREFPSNWELSTARAGAVVRFLVEKGLNSKRFEAIGYADTRPRVEYTHPIEGQPENRRIVVVVSPEAYSTEYVREKVSVDSIEEEYDKVKEKLILPVNQPQTQPISKYDTAQEQQKQSLSYEKRTADISFVEKNKLQQKNETKLQQEQIEEKQPSVEKKRLMEQYFMLGQQKLKEKNYNAAIIYFKRVLEIDPNHTLSKVNIARAKKLLQQQ
ncbi:MAG: OmpA family protein [Elusimicrobiota bacterium]|nr:OmpA family protein [Elusimicrobiota bacterium]